MSVCSEIESAYVCECRERVYGEIETVKMYRVSVCVDREREIASV